jgi:hypothetical protein
MEIEQRGHDVRRLADIGADGKPGRQFGELIPGSILATRLGDSLPASSCRYCGEFQCSECEDGHTLCPQARQAASSLGTLVLKVPSVLFRSEKSRARREHTGRSFGVNLGGLAARYAEGFPLSCFGERKMLGEKQNLANVMSVVSDLAVDGLHDGVRLGTNRDCSREVRLRERFERVEKIFPAAFPHFDYLGAGCGWGLKFRVAVAVGFFPIRGQEIEPARAHIAGHVLHKDGDGIGFRIQGDEQGFVRALRHRAVTQLFVVAK